MEVGVGVELADVVGVVEEVGPGVEEELQPAKSTNAEAANIAEIDDFFIVQIYILLVESLLCTISQENAF